MATYPKDRFDTVPDDLHRIGAHRGAAGRARGWVTFAWAALATGVLVVAGLFGLAVIRGNVTLPFVPAASPEVSDTPTPTPTPTVTPLLDASVPITILNGTTTRGLANSVGDNLVKQGWLGAAADVGTRSNAATTTVAETIVYYNDPSHEAAAKALVLSLKIGTIQLSTAYTESPITVVIGKDYVLP